MKHKLMLKFDDIADNQACKVDVGEQEILISKIDGKLYAVGDRCGHMNASLSEGEINEGIVTCPMHKAQFDIRSGNNLRRPKVPKMLSPTKMGKLMNGVKTHNLPSFKVEQKDGELFIEI